MKYVMIQIADLRFPILFPDMLTHSDVAKAYIGGEDRRHSPGKVVSAGFYDPVTHETSGRSESLDLGPHPDDSALMQSWMALGDAMLIFINATLKVPENQGTTVNVIGLAAPSPANEQINHDSNPQAQGSGDSLGGPEELQPAGSAQ
jgi:hypothetical protein